MTTHTPTSSSSSDYATSSAPEPLGTPAVTVDAEDLKRALRLTSPGIAKGTRGGLPIDRGVELSLSFPHTPELPGALTLTTFNGTTSVRVVVRVDPPAPTDTPHDTMAASTTASTPGSTTSVLGSVVVEHPQLRDALKGLPRRAHVAVSITPTAVEIGRSGGVTITTPNGVFSLPTIGAGRFPFLPTPNRGPGVIGPAEVKLFTTTVAGAVAGFKAVHRSASTDHTLPRLCTMAVHVVPGQPVAVEATDRYRLTRWQTGGDVWDGAALARPRLLLPADPVAAFATVLNRAVPSDSPVTLTVDGGGALARRNGTGWATLSVAPQPAHTSTPPRNARTARAATGGVVEVRATFALLDDDYPSVESLWPKETTHTAQVDAAALAVALRRAVTDAGRPSLIGVRLTPEDVVVTATPEDPQDPRDSGTGQETPVTDGPTRQEIHTPAPGGYPTLAQAPTIGMTPAYLTDALNTFEGDVTISGTSERRPWSFTDAGPIRVLLMTARLPQPR